MAVGGVSSNPPQAGFYARYAISVMMLPMSRELPLALDWYGEMLATL